jgi:Na+-transporting NADH:ubiquinone oxidoreductase subunit NqrC
MKWYIVFLLLVITLIAGIIYGQTVVTVGCERNNEFRFGHQTYICVPEEVILEKESYKLRTTI